MNIRPYIIINGVDSQSIAGLIITKLPPISKPLQRTLIETIDGRSGDSVTNLGFSAYDRVISIGLSRNYDLDEIIDYFNSEGAIVFSNEPDKVYSFGIYEQIDFERLIRFKTADVTIHCQPFKRALYEPELTFSLSDNPSTVKIYNAGNIQARPLLELTATGTVSLTLNGSEILIIEFGEDEQTIFIDSETLDAYNADKELLNRLVIGNYDNIILNKGINTLVITGSASELKVSNYTRYI